jgi:hypothetical protein
MSNEPAPWIVATSTTLQTSMIQACRMRRAAWYRAKADIDDQAGRAVALEGRCTKSAPQATAANVQPEYQTFSWTYTSHSTVSFSPSNDSKINISSTACRLPTAPKNLSDVQGEGYALHRPCGTVVSLYMSPSKYKSTKLCHLYLYCAFQRAHNH